VFEPRLIPPLRHDHRAGEIRAPMRARPSALPPARPRRPAASNIQAPRITTDRLPAAAEPVQFTRPRACPATEMAY
jgi:hypothetical protein